jgi:hypothetical protein
MGVDIGAGAGVDREPWGSWEEGQVDGMDPSVGGGMFSERDFFGEGCGCGGC